MAPNSRKQLHERLWAAAEQLRANSSLKLNEISEPILGLIFLKFADVKFRRAKAAIAAEHEQLTGRKPPITPDHYKQRGVPYIREHAGYTYLMNLPEGENIGKAINNAMKTIEEENRELAGILPQEYSKLSSQPAENSRILLTLLKNFNQIPDDIEGDAFGGIYEYFLGEFARSEGRKGGEFFDQAVMDDAGALAAVRHRHDARLALALAAGDLSARAWRDLPSGLNITAGRGGVKVQLRALA